MSVSFPRQHVMPRPTLATISPPAGVFTSQKLTQELATIRRRGK